MNLVSSFCDCSLIANCLKLKVLDHDDSASASDVSAEEPLLQDVCRSQPVRFVRRDAFEHGVRRRQRPELATLDNLLGSHKVPSSEQYKIHNTRRYV